MSAVIRSLAQVPRLQQFFKFCMVGGSGVVVDMTVLHFLVDPNYLGWNVSLSKLCSAEAAMLNNFLWNEVWTFRGAAADRARRRAGGSRSDPPAAKMPPVRRGRGVVRRLLWFHAICGAGIGLAVFFLHVFYSWLDLNLYMANFLAILLVTLWNFWLNALFNWRLSEAGPKQASVPPSQQ